MAGTGIYGELLKAQLENLASDPASTSVGRLYWNTTTQSARIYTSSGWDDFGAGGGGAAGRNYLTDWFDGDRDPGSVTNSITATGNITISTTAWQASDTSKLTVARTSSSPLRQTYSILLDHVATGAAFVQTPCFLLDAVDLGKPVTVSFDVANVVTSDDYQVYAVRYTSGGTYQEQITIAGTASATSPYSARIPTGTTKFQGFFIAGSTSTDYYVIRFYRNSASDTTDIKVDSLYAGPEKVVQGAGISDWYSPTVESVLKYGTTTATNIAANYPKSKICKDGDSAVFNIKVPFSGAANANGSFQLTLPDSLAIDITKLPDGANSVVGKVSGVINSDIWNGICFVNVTGRILSFYTASDADSGVTVWAGNTTAGSNNPGAAALTNSDYIDIYTHRVPIVGWSSNTTMADRAVEEQCATSSTWDADDTGLASLVRGYAGGAITGALTTSRTKRVRFNTPIQVNDDIEIKFARGSGQVYTLSAQFIDGSGNRIVNSESSAQTIATSSGVYWRPVSGSNTDIDVIFARYAALANDDSPAQDWVNGWYWIANKVSGGAAVGYPISPANITKAIARYTTNAAQSIDHAGSGEVIDFEDKVFDTKNNVTTGASWKFTASEAGYYRVSATVLLNSGGGWAAAEAASIMIRRSGTIYSRADAYQTASHTAYVTCHVDDVVYLENGQYVDILIYQNSGGAITLFNSNDYNFVSIEQIM